MPNAFLQCQPLLAYSQHVELKKFKEISTKTYETESNYGNIADCCNTAIIKLN